MAGVGDRRPTPPEQGAHGTAAGHRDESDAGGSQRPHGDAAHETRTDAGAETETETAPRAASDARAELDISTGPQRESDTESDSESDDEPVVPRWWHSQPLGLWWLLPAGFLASGWFLWAGQLRSFGYSVAATLLAAALVRVALPRDSVGGLMVRSRTWDTVILVGMAAALAGATWSLDLT